MCGRFTLRKDSDALAGHFEVEDAHPIPPRYNIAPSQQIPVVRINPATGRHEMVMQRWGLDPPWAKGNGPDKLLINARAETLASRPAFRSAFLHRRCLIPADGFYEWQKLEKSKQPWFIRMKSDALFAFAGLWEPASESAEAPIPACTIITTPPLPMHSRIHDRMPAILQPNDYGVWLDAQISAPALLSPLLQANRAFRSGEELEMYRVRAPVNRAENDTPDCIAAAWARERAPHAGSKGVNSMAREQLSGAEFSGHYARRDGRARMTALICAERRTLVRRAAPHAGSGASAACAALF